MDATIVGSGPNGLAAAVTLARAGWSVQVIEAAETIGGGTRTSELTLPGFLHDECSAIHPLAQASPFFRRAPLAQHGLRFVQPPAAMAHPFEDGTAALLERSVRDTAATLGPDGGRYQRLMGPLVAGAEGLISDVLGPLRVPAHPFLLAQFGLLGLLPARTLAERFFRGERARALFAGSAGHSMLRMEQSPSAAFGLVLTILGHAVGWPVAIGGSQSIANALASYLRSLGGTIETGHRVESLSEVASSRAVLLDAGPRELLKIAAHQLPPTYQRQLSRYRYGPGVFKIDWALDGPIPWLARECARAATVHLGGTLDEISLSERAAWSGQHAEHPFVILAQQTLFDPSRAPQGKDTAWAYCHVPHDSTFDMTDRIEAQVERFAPGFRNRILARATRTAAQMEQHNPNMVGGDINGGVQDLRQLFTRPVPRLNPYTTPIKGLYLCSSSTPPGGGVHGMSGYWGARAALSSR